MQEVTTDNYIYFKRAKRCTLAGICCVFFAMYLWKRFTDAMNFIRYEVKSASRNVTNAFGKITSVVWIQSLWQPTANDTGGNFLRRRRWAILLLAGATNWQIGTKSRRGGINVWWQNYCCCCAHMHRFKMLPLHIGNIRGHIKTHHASVTKAQSCHFTLCCVNNNNPHKDVLMALVCVCVSKFSKAPPPPKHSKCLGNHGNTCTKKTSS